MTNPVPASTVYTAPTTGLVGADTGRYEWANQEWVKELFESNPILVSLAEKHRDGGGFDFNFIVVVKTPAGYRHRLLEWSSFSYASIQHYLEELVADYPNLASRWLDDAPSASDIRVVINRGHFGLGVAVDTIAAQQKQKVLEENREWMQQAFKAFPGITRIVKSANTLRSPTTFALCFENDHTWMKAPTFERIRIRMKMPRNSLRSSPPREVWVPGPGPAEGIEFTREDFTTMSHEKSTLAELAASGLFNLRVQATRLGLLDTEEAKQCFMSMDNMAAAKLVYEKMQSVEKSKATDEQKHAAVVAAMREEPKVVDVCTSCGASFGSNLQFGRGDERLCGECELKRDEESGERRVQIELVFNRKRRRLAPVRSTKHDPRPGIDDQGAWASPSWEDDT